MENEHSTVVVGTAPPLEDIISGAFTERPFDLESFTAYARKHLFVENLEFLKKVNNMRQEQGPRQFRSQLLHIMAEYIRADSRSEVNLSDRVRKETQGRAVGVLEAMDKDPAAQPPDRACLDEAYKAILGLVRTDQYARYKNHIVVQRQLRVSRLDALWWTQLDDLTFTRFFSFPSPVNNAESRLHACLVVILIPLACYLAVEGVPWLWAYVAYGFLARVTCGPRLDPNAFLVLFVLRPLVADRLGLVKNEFGPGSPKRFTQFVGLIFSAICTLLAFFELYAGMVVVASCMFVASFLAGICDFCFACKIFMLGVRLKMLPKSVCDDCSIRYIKGAEQGTPRSQRNTPKSKKTPKNHQNVRIGSGDGNGSKQVCARRPSPANGGGGGDTGSRGGSDAGASHGPQQQESPATMLAHHEEDAPSAV